MNINHLNNQFKEKGYVLLKNFFNEEEKNFIIENADMMEKWKEESGKWMIYFENSDNKNNNKNKARLEHFINYNEKLKLFLQSKITPLVNEITDEKLLLFKEKLNWKMPKGKGFKTHQDHPAWIDFEPNMYITVALFADLSTKEKGCLEFSNYYEKKLLPYEKEKTGKLDINIENKLEWKYIETTPYDLLIFNSYAPHRSGDNLTNEKRRIFYFTYNSEEYGDLYDNYFIKKRQEFPPDIERKCDDNIKILNNKYNLANPII